MMNMIIVIMMYLIIILCQRQILKKQFTTASLSIDNIGRINDVTDEKFMEYYNNNLKSRRW